VQFSSRQLADVVVAVPAGRIDQAAAADFERALLPLLEQCCADQDAMVLDFTDVEYISSVGLRVLMIAAKKSRAAGTRIGIAGLQPLMAEIFAISRFDKVLEVFPSVRDALAQLSPKALAAVESHPDAPDR